MKKIKLDNKKWIGDQISNEDIANWANGSIITIEAGTGTGKSHFIKNNLYEKALAEGKKILFLVHRNACFDQFEKDIEGKESVIKLMKYQTLETICNC